MNNILSAYEKKSLHDSFYEILVILEIWKKILPLTQKAVINEKEKEADWIKLWENEEPEAVKKILISNLRGFRIFFVSSLKEKKGFQETKKELKQEFYKWIDATRIKAGTASPDLKDVLFIFHEILEGNEVDEWIKKVRKEIKERLKEEKKNLSDEELQKQWIDSYNELNKHLYDEGKKEEELKGKNWNEIVFASKFKGEKEKGERTLKQIISRENPILLKTNVQLKETNKNSNFHTPNKEFPWKIVVPLSLLGLFVVIAIVMLKKRDREQKR